MRILLTLIVLFGVVHNNVSAQDSDAGIRMWTDVTGQFKVEAALVRVTRNEVTLRTAAGADITVPLEKLNADGIKHARQGFRFHYTPGPGSQSLNELGQKYLDAIKKQDGGAILDMYIPWDVMATENPRISGLTEERKNEARKRWELEFKDEQDPQSPQGQRVPHFLNGEFQRRKATQGFDLTAAQFVEVQGGHGPAAGWLTAPGPVAVKGDPTGQFAHNPRIIFKLPNYPDRLFYIDMADCIKFAESRWYLARFGNTRDFFGFCIPKSPKEAAKTSIAIERLMAPFENLTIGVGFADYSRTKFSGATRHADGTLGFRQRDADGKLVFAPIQELPPDVYVSSVSVEGKEGSTSTGIRELITVLREIPSLRSLTFNSIPDDLSEIVNAVERLPCDLEVIRLMSLPALSDADAARIFSRHRLVSSVSISDCQNLGSKTIQAILSEKHLQSLDLSLLPKVAYDDLVLCKNCVDLNSLYLGDLPLSSFDIQRLLAETTAQVITLSKTTLTPADVRILRTAPEMPWEWRNLTLSGVALKGLSDAEQTAIEETFESTNDGTLSIR